MNQAVVERADTNVAAHPASDTTSLLQVITRAASDASVDIDKMERLMQMHERLVARDAKAAYAAALAEMQPDLPVIGRNGTISVPAKDGKTGHNTPYALWEDINEAIRPLLHKHGFALSFRIKKEADRVEVTSILSHRQGHSDETTLSLPMDTTGSKNNVQAIGSSISYGKRYGAMALLNITTRGEDDDARAAGAPAAINDQQRTELDKLLDETASDEARFFDFFKIQFLAELPAARFAEAKAMLEQKKARK
jgi:hypothetical protein